MLKFLLLLADMQVCFIFVYVINSTLRNYEKRLEDTDNRKF